jgi:hypothetical protein
MRKIYLSGLALLFSTVFATAALAAPLTANHSYTVQLSTVSATGQLTPVNQMDATTDASGKLNFQFSNVPDTGSASYLMVQIMDTVGGQTQLVRQTLVPAPTPGQQMGMGVNEVSYRQTQAALQAMQTTTGTAGSTLGVLFPMTMISTGAIPGSAAGNIGQAANDAATAFRNTLTQGGVTTNQMASFQSGLLDAMRTYAANNETVAMQTDPNTAADLYGRLRQGGAGPGQFDGTCQSSVAGKGDHSGDLHDGGTTAPTVVPNEPLRRRHAGPRVGHEPDTDFRHGTADASERLGAGRRKLLPTGLRRPDDPAGPGHPRPGAEHHGHEHAECF